MLSKITPMLYEAISLKEMAVKVMQIFESVFKADRATIYTYNYSANEVRLM